MSQKKITTFGEKLRALRESRNLSYRKLEKLLDDEHGITISHTAIRKWELAAETVTIPKKEVVAALCRIFNVTPDFLLEEMFSPAVTKTITDRSQEWMDVNLLSDEDHKMLLQLKRRLLERQILNKEA